MKNTSLKNQMKMTGTKARSRLMSGMQIKYTKLGQILRSLLN
ncbi:Hypothetical protein ETEE_2573 [Edwardsiella anguillarum ET080813]|uniref:Uncharacterized protein n=1 Tax=Edwardsiella anguillarum ET080813 TaxID=667120 RepID=A0A076LKQ3_9GAMM|nr:Hypothetical protein ETEE_2573 [Edwardsiella anguillarum ET080813]